MYLLGCCLEVARNADHKLFASTRGFSVHCAGNTVSLVPSTVSTVLNRKDIYIGKYSMYLFCTVILILDTGGLANARHCERLYL